MHGPVTSARLDCLLALALALPLASLGCASVQGDAVARPIQSTALASGGGADKPAEQTALGLVVSGEVVAEMASRHFEELVLTFENRTARWVRIVAVTLQFASSVPDDEIKLPVGEELMAWIEAAQREALVREHNTGVALGVLSAAGTVVAGVGASQRNGGLVAAGGVMMLGALTAGTVRGVEQARDAAGAVAMVPAGHLLAGPIAVPPGLHAKRWVTLYCQRPDALRRVSTVNITYRTDGGDTETVALTFRRLLPQRPATATE